MEPTFLAEPPRTSAYDDDLESDGYVYNLTRLWSWRPDVMTSFKDLRAGLLADSSLTAREVAVMVTATAAARGDSYCALAWGNKLAGLADDPTAAKVIQGQDASALSAREAALAAWSRQVVGDPNATAKSDVDGLRDAGFSDREIFEATTWIALRLAFSTVNDALGARPDRELALKVPDSVREAVNFGRAAGGRE